MADDVKRFVLNDETVENSYGFYVSTQGIKLDRFLKNPVMLSDHNNSNSAVLGAWAKLEKEGHLLTGEPVFDVEDPDSEKVAGKVARGFIKGASMGLLFSREDMVFLDGKIWLKQCELVEGTIIPVPSNSAALRLYLKGQEDTPLTEEQVKSMCLSLGESQNQNFKSENFMKKIMLSLGALLALGFKDAPKDGLEESEIETKIMGLSNRVEAAEKKAKDLETENTQLKEQLQAQNLQAATTLVDNAITAGKIPADKKEAFLTLAKTDLVTAQATLDAIPAKKSLGAEIVTGGAAGSAEIKTLDDFEKLPLEKQLAFKQDHPEDFKKLLN